MTVSRQLGWNVLALDPRSFRPKATLKRAFGGTPRRDSNNEDVYDLSALAQRMRSIHPPEDSPHLDEVTVESEDSSDETFSLGSDIPSPPDSPIGNGESSFNRSLMYRDEGKENRGDQMDFGHLEDEENMDLVGGTEDEPDEQMHTLLQDSTVDSMEDTPPNTLPVSWPSLQSGPLDLITDAELVDDLLLSAIDTAEDMPNNDDDSDIQEGGGDGDGEHMDNHGEEEEEEEEDEDEDDDTQGDDEVYNYEYAAFQYGGSNGDNSLLESLQQHSQGGGSFDELFPDISSWLSGTEDPEPPKPLFADFPILHFTQNSVRMFPHPFAKKSSIILREALSQNLNDAPPNLDMVERFNMVHQIPELGIVLAASQKGRVGIFSLTESPDGMAFRLDHIIPFESQESRGARPLVQIAGMAVGPVESHLIPLDEISSSTSSQKIEDNHATAPAHSRHSHHTGKSQSEAEGKASTSTFDSHEVSDSGSPLRQEQWHGIEFSRRYRLLLMYTNLTVMHYELFYDWPTDMMGPHGRLLHEVGRGSLLRP